MSYLDELGARIEHQLPADRWPPEGKSELLRCYALLALVKGEEVTAADVHNAWAVWKSAIDPRHEALVPFEALDAATREKDEPYAGAIRAVAAASG